MMHKYFCSKTNSIYKLLTSQKADRFVLIFLVDLISFYPKQNITNSNCRWLPLNNHLNEEQALRSKFLVTAKGWYLQAFLEIGCQPKHFNFNSTFYEVLLSTFILWFWLSTFIFYTVILAELVKCGMKRSGQGRDRTLYLLGLNWTADVSWCSWSNTVVWLVSYSQTVHWLACEPFKRRISKVGTHTHTQTD